MSRDVPFSVTQLLDMTPSYENRVRVKGFQPSKALGIRIGEGSTILTFTEVKKLRVSTYPNSCAVMLRTLLEMCISYYLDEKGKIKAILGKFAKKGKGKDWYPSLQQMLNYILNEDPDISLSPLSL